MKISYLIKLLIKRWMWIILVPVTAAIVVYFFSIIKPKQYSSTMTVYTGITSGSANKPNSPNIDYSQALIAYDNLMTIMKSKKTLQEVGLRLFCQVLQYGKNDDKYISRDSYNDLLKTLPEDLLKLAVKDSVGDLYPYCKAYLNKNDDNYLYELINKGGTYYSVSSLSTIESRRVNSSDVIEFSYTTFDAALCYRTLTIMYQVVKENYLALKSEESKDVEQYYTTQADELRNRLQSEEDKVVNYSKENKIINYEEQSKIVITQKYALDDKLDALEMTAQASERTISELEKKMGSQNRLRLKSTEVLAIRNEIARVSAEQASKSFFTGDTTKVYQAYNKRLADLRKQFRVVVDSLHLMQTTIEGVQIESILNQWLTNVVLYDQAKAQMPIIQRRSVEVNALFEQFSPIGANLKRSEREIKVTEQQYLDVLDGLHTVRSRSQTEKMSIGSISMIDAPTYPYRSLPNKSLMLAFVTLIATIFLIIALIVIFEFLDHTMSNVERAERFSKLKVGFVYPLISNNTEDRIIGDLEQISSEFLAIDLTRVAKKETVVNLFSIYEKEGKSFIKKKLEEGLERIDTLNNTTTAQQIKIREFNPLGSSYLDKSEIDASHINILVCRSNRGWKQFDSRIINLIKEQTGVTPILLLNGVKLYVVEAQWENFPIKRSYTRKLIKRIFDLEFALNDKF